MHPDQFKDVGKLTPQGSGSNESHPPRTASERWARRREQRLLRETLRRRPGRRHLVLLDLLLFLFVDSLWGSLIMPLFDSLEERWSKQRDRSSRDRYS